MTGTDTAVTTSLIDRAHGSLIGGLIGDAMGTPSEGLEPEEIDAGFGWIEDFAGDGTDDSIMKYLLADALIATDGNADAGFLGHAMAEPAFQDRRGDVRPVFRLDPARGGEALLRGASAPRGAWAYAKLDRGDVDRPGRHRQCGPPPGGRRADAGDRQPGSCR